MQSPLLDMNSINETDVEIIKRDVHEIKENVGYIWCFMKCYFILFIITTMISLIFGFIEGFK